MKELQELTKLIADPEVISNQSEWQKLMKEHASIEDIVIKFREYKKVKQNMEEAEELMQDPEMKELAETEYYSAKEELPKIEEELSMLDDEDRQMFLDDLGLEESGLDRLVKEAYALLGLCTFFTAGEKECRAWTFRKGMLAPQCAGVIHSDFERGFIRAETYSYEDLVEYGTPLKVKEAGKVRLEGKDYVVRDGDIMLFRFNV